MNMKLFLSIFWLLFCVFVAHGQKKFSCPMKKGKIIIAQSDNEMKLNAEARFKGKNRNVCSSSPGTVMAVDTSRGHIVIGIKFEKYFFFYHYLETAEVLKGQNVFEGQRLGKVKKGEDLVVNTSEGPDEINPLTILNCKTIIVNIDN